MRYEDEIGLKFENPKGGVDANMIDEKRVLLINSSSVRIAFVSVFRKDDALR